MTVYKLACVAMVTLLVGGGGGSGGGFFGGVSAQRLPSRRGAKGGVIPPLKVPKAKKPGVHGW